MCFTLKDHIQSHVAEEIRLTQSLQVQEKFSEYYKKYSVNLIPPSMIRQREFGFILLKEGIMLRHKSFENLGNLRSFLASTTPSDVYHSSAYYEKPEAVMKEKGWLGADLVFDIDADHIPTPCNKVHDRWICSSCGFAGLGACPDKCPSCEGARFDSRTWTCEACLESAKDETRKLLRILTEDFGLDDDKLSVYYSGNRGYHVHVESKSIHQLDSAARKEIADYTIGLGFTAGLHGLIGKGRIVIGPSSERTGWRASIASGVNEFLIHAENTDLEKLGLPKKIIDFLIKNRRTILSRLSESGWIDVKGVGVKSWNQIIDWIADRQASKIDTVVTTDIHRLIRLGGSLHGKTGFKKTKVPPFGLDQFDPLDEGVAFEDGEMVVNIVEAPRFRIGENYYGPFRKESKIALPTAAALFLLCRGAAQGVE